MDGTFGSTGARGVAPVTPRETAHRMPRKKLLAVSGQSEGGETEAVRDEEGRLVNIPYMVSGKELGSQEQRIRR